MLLGQPINNWIFFIHKYRFFSRILLIFERETLYKFACSLIYLIKDFCLKYWRKFCERNTHTEAKAFKKVYNIVQLILHNNANNITQSLINLEIISLKITKVEVDDYMHKRKHSYYSICKTLLKEFLQTMLLYGYIIKHSYKAKFRKMLA